jgi:hypothetical protein
MTPEDIVLMLRGYAGDIAQHELTDWERGYYKGLLKAAQLVKDAS